jgi:DNA polymerase III subunit epsilon
MTQQSFDFDAAPPLPPSPPPVPAVEQSAEAAGHLLVPVAEHAAAVSPADPGLESLAQRLEQHPDYRVLRRLVPCLDYGPGPADQAAPGAVQHVLVLDTETTGLSHRSDQIIELAMLLVAVDTATGLPFGPVTVFEGFEDPGMPIPAVAQAVTGISDEMVRGHRLDDAAVRALVERADLVLAHNAGFDRPFVEARFPFFADKAWACSFADIDWKAIGSGSAKLSALANDRGWFYDAHRAQVDCHALLQVLAQPLTPDAPITGLAHLLQAAERPGYKLAATGAPFEAKDKLKARGYRWDAEARVWCCTLTSPALLDAECEWLRAEVYGRRVARLEVAELNSRVRYSLRSGELSEREI